uniref:Uncharacterized protein n=1 Tax=Anguilla anguilla TaxID=7936 RepID=A0A0E9SZ91_ANGAN
MLISDFISVRADTQQHYIAYVLFVPGFFLLFS